jgi:DNA primase catalytic core
MNIVEFYQACVLPQLNRSAIFYALNIKDKGDHYSADCPQCAKHEAYIYKNSDTLICNRKSNCGYAVSIPTYINGGTPARGREFFDAIKKICDLSNIAFAPGDLVQEKPRDTTHDFRQHFLTTFFDITRNALLNQNQENNKEAQKYLASRGWHRQALEKAEFGFYADCQWILEQLQKAGYSYSEVVQSGIYRSDWANRIVHPWRDQRKNIINFWARTFTHTDSETKKYLVMSSEKGGSKSIPFGMSWVKSHEVIIVEGFFDALTLKSHGFTNVIATGQAGISKEQLKALEHADITSLTLLFDNDEAGQRALEQSVDKLSNSDFTVFVMPGAYLFNAKDPDDFCKLYGAETLTQGLDVRINAFRYKAHKLIEKYTSTDVGADSLQNTLLQAAHAFDETITNPLRAVDLTLFWNEIASLMQCDKEALEIYRKALEQKKEKAEQVTTCQLFYKELGEALTNNNYLLVEEKVVAYARTLKEQESNTQTKPITRLHELLDNHDKMLASYKGTEFIGLCQKTLPALDVALSGLRKLILLAAGPNAGKTALTIQNALDIIKHNPDACLLYVSLEMSAQDIITRMQCSITHMAWNTLIFGSDRKAYSGAYFNEEEQTRLTIGRQLLGTLGTRIAIVDTENCPDVSAEVLLAQVKHLKAKTATSRVVIVIDYLQVWPVPPELEGKLRTDIELDKWRIGQMKKLKDALGQDPVIVISEARKPGHPLAREWGSDLSDVMGSARTTYTPDVVLMLIPLSDNELHEEWISRNHTVFSQDKAENGAKIRQLFESQGYTINRLKISKARDGMRRGELMLKFYFQANRFEQVNWDQEIEKTLCISK